MDKRRIIQNLNFDIFMILNIIAHLEMMVDSFIHEAYICTGQNIIGFVLTLVIFISNRKRPRPVYWMFYVILHIQVQVFLGLVQVGWTSGFQVFYLGTLVSSVYVGMIVNSKNAAIKQRILIANSFIFFYLGYACCRNMEPIYRLDAGSLDKIQIMNFSIVFAGLTVMTMVLKNNILNSLGNYKNQAARDQLTGLYNRRGIRPTFDTVQNQWVGDSVPYSIAIIDIDDFKMINDTYGHNFGDKVLKSLSDLILARTSKNIRAARWGGEEFLIIAQTHWDRNEFSEFISSLAREFSSMEFLKNNDIHLTFTAGCAMSEKDLPIHELIAKADERLYIGKTTGKNKVVTESQ